MKRSGKKMRAGFTLIELLIVLAIIGALMAIGIPIYTNALQNAKATTVAANIRTLADQIRLDITLNGKASHELSQTISTLNDATKLDISGYIKLDDSSNYVAAYVEGDATFAVYAGYIGSDVPHDKVEDKIKGCDNVITDKDIDSASSVLCEIEVPKTSF